MLCCCSFVYVGIAPSTAYTFSGCGTYVCVSVCLCVCICMCVCVSVVYLCVQDVCDTYFSLLRVVKHPFMHHHGFLHCLHPVYHSTLPSE